MITIKDVAKRAGVSIATVSRVINQSPSVTEQSIQRVQQAIDELGYQPNSIARSLQLGHSGLIGMIVPQLDHPFFSRLVEAAEQRCVEHGCRLVLCCSNSEETREKEFVQMLRRNRVDGMLIATRTPNLGYLDGYDIPVVGVERSIASNVPFVACDNYTGGVLAAQALLSRGSKHPAVLCRPSFRPVRSSFMPGDLREKGFIDTCTAQNVACISATPDSSFNDQKAVCIAFLQDFFRAHPEADSLFTTSDVTAAWAYAFFAEKGISIPDQMQIIGFDGIDAARYLGITTVAQPIVEMGRTAVELLLSLSTGQSAPMKTVLPVQLISRRSTRQNIQEGT